MTAVLPGGLLRREIEEQPAVWARLVGEGAAGLQAAADLLRDVDPELVVLAARGTSDHAATYAQYLIHSRLGVPAMLATPSAFTAYRAQLRYPRTLMVAVSQSGESPDLIETVRSAKAAGVTVLAITNTPGSTVARLGDLHLDLGCGPELSVAATKTYTASLLALHVVVGLAAGDAWETLRARVGAAVEAAEDLLHDDVPEPGLLDAALTADRMVVVGRGLSMSSAREGALKLMETNRVAASGWSAADATHGPLGQVGPGTLVLLLTAGEATRASVVDFGRRAADLGGVVVTVGPAARLAPSFEVPLPDGVDETLLPLLEILPFQLLAHAAALGRGLDPDNPPGLAKVTRTT
ncbi:SIS domain-containing protein [Klenkia taihuensis]|uniref:Glutamine--fructose-6-phosphate transaminase n=1 Tax=Klenkia taihuensis TaxID=1225127 RepID=A0A1I1HVQ5_9ACTN|nr:SIS domain-containing protein [Klenkia taihuensis]GHE08979.1 glucosamine-6-phosphate deaminase [Klenkia taihuensis]SFC28137.1 glutamine--fructose-6-phosphate transaminase [Klenkia taihuensis]